jgi:hypothetical protein
MVESRQEECLTIIAIFTVLAFLFVTGRVYSRYLGRNFAWDDYLIIISMVLLFGQTIATWKCECLSWLLACVGKLTSSSRTFERYWLPCLRSSKEVDRGTGYNEQMEFRRTDVLSPNDVRDQGIYH